ncbi:DUF1963 domain-containing protein [Naumannella sp. ID2617S]|nr:DUF1963 domain-containing protein [Naumannella sp. ID2617S]
MGGIPYWLPGDRWPTGFDVGHDRPIRLPWLGQLNLGELPALPGFPSSGLLQCWVPLELYRGHDLVCHVRHRPISDPSAVLVDDPALGLDDRRLISDPTGPAITGELVRQLWSPSSREFTDLAEADFSRCRLHHELAC